MCEGYGFDAIAASNVPTVHVTSFTRKPIIHLSSSRLGDHFITDCEQRNYPFCDTVKCKAILSGINIELIGSNNALIDETTGNLYLQKDRTGFGGPLGGILEDSSR